MEIKPIKTRKVVPPQDEIWDILDEVAKMIREGNIVAITSKIVSIHEGRTIKEENEPDRDKLAKGEAQYWLERSEVPGEHMMHTIACNSLVGSSGIDHSNTNGYWVMYPKDPFKSAESIHKYLSEKSSVKKFGVIITDSHCQPLRRGTVGFALSYWGFNPLRDYIGTPDIFGHNLRVTKMDVADALGTAATFVMGEGIEQTPIAIISGVEESIEFIDGAPPIAEHMVKPEEDLFKPFYSIFKKN